jgi:hypothetical protein
MISGYYILSEAAYSVFEILTPPFFMAHEVFKEKSKKMNMTTRKKTKIFNFQPILNYFTILESFEFFFQKINRLIVSSINRFFVNFSSIFIVLARKGC